MDRAIKEIVSSIVQRSVTIAIQTTRELVLKVAYHWFMISAHPHKEINVNYYCLGELIN